MVLTQEELGGGLSEFGDTADSSILVIHLALENFRFSLATLNRQHKLPIDAKIHVVFLNNFTLVIFELHPKKFK